MIDPESERAIGNFLARIGRGREVVAAFVFGSRVRDDHDEDSDLDVAVIVRDRRRSLPLDLDVADNAYAILEDTGTHISPLLISTAAWKKPRLHANPELLVTIKREGKLVAANLDAKSNDAATKFVQLLRANLQIEAAYLIGSRARGDFHPGSDLDLVIIVDDERDGLSGPDVSQSTSAVFKKFSIVVSPVFTTSSIWKRPETAHDRWLAETVQREGVEIFFGNSAL